MKAIIRFFDEGDHPMQNLLPLLDFSIHGAPHKRQDREVIQRYREDLYALAVRRIADKVILPIDFPLELNVLFTNPCSPDIDHLIEALYMALDGKTLEGPSILTDDRHIQGIRAFKYYPNPPTKRDGER
jgi:hypothetical protein